MFSLRKLFAFSSALSRRSKSISHSQLIDNSRFLQKIYGQRDSTLSDEDPANQELLRLFDSIDIRDEQQRSTFNEFFLRFEQNRLNSIDFFDASKSNDDRSLNHLRYVRLIKFLSIDRRLTMSIDKTVEQIYKSFLERELIIETRFVSDVELRS